MSIPSQQVTRKPHHQEKVNSALLMLSSAAMALPAISQGATPPEKPKVSFRIENYKEDGTAVTNPVDNETRIADRYDIDVFHVKGVIPYNDKLSFTVDVDYESMSGATPWYSVKKTGSDEAEVVLSGAGQSGASVDDKRLDMKVGVTHYLKEGTVGGSLGISDEEDYQSFYGSFGVGLEFYKKAVMLDLGTSFSTDEITPTKHYSLSDPSVFRALPGDATRVVDARKSSFGLYVGFTQIINKLTTFQSGLNYTVKTGYLTDPYKLVSVLEAGDQSPTVRNEVRPDDRTQLAWVNRYRMFIERFQAALHLDYRFYTDNWGVDSHTMEASWHHPWREWTFVPGVRYYTQGAADFYEPYFDTETDDGFYSSDYRLSDFSASSIRLRVERDFGAWKGIASYETYSPSGDSPGLTDFTVLTFGVDYTF